MKIEQLTQTLVEVTLDNGEQYLLYEDPQTHGLLEITKRNGGDMDVFIGDYSPESGNKVQIRYEL